MQSQSQSTDKLQEVTQPKTKRGPGPRGLKVKARQQKEKENQVTKPNERLIFKDVLFELNNFKKHQHSPKVDLKESNDKFFVRVELPGVVLNDIKIYIRDSVFLIISGTKYTHNTKDVSTDVYSECNYGYFTRRVKVSQAVDTKFDEYTERGVLYLTLYKDLSKQTVDKKITKNVKTLNYELDSEHEEKPLDEKMETLEIKNELEEKPLDKKMETLETKNDFSEITSWADEI